MSPGEVVRALLARWYVVVLAAVLTVAGAYHVLRPEQRFTSSAVVVVKPPVTGNQPNQYVNLQPPLASVSYAVIQQLRSPAGRAELAAAGMSGPFSLTPRNSGTSVTPQYLIPSLQVQAQRTDPGTADQAVRTVISVYSQHIDALQTAQGIPAGSRMSIDILVPPNSVPLTGTRSRALAGVALTGLVGGILAALWTDRLLRRRATGGLRRRGVPEPLPASR